MTAPTAAQNAFWRKFQANVSGVPERFAVGRYACPCGHPGDKRSLKVNYEGRRVTGHCFEAGCGWSKVLDRLGLKRVDLDDDGPARGGKPAGVFTYTDEDGAELLRVHRYVKPDSTRYEVYRAGGWTWDNGAGAKGPHLLYRLPDVVAAVEGGERVWLAEGEPGADALHAAGVVGTAIAGKPAAVLRTDHIERLRGGYVTIVARRSEAGRAWARAQWAALAEVAADVTVVEPATNRPGAGAADHLAASFGLDDFAPLTVEGTAGASGIVEGTGTVAVPVEEGAAVLADVETFLRRFVVFSTRAQSVAVALWVVHTWCFAAAETTLYLHVSSPEKQSGKTRLLEVLVLVCRGALQAADMTAAAVFRSIGDPAPTILFDEVQELFARNAGDEQKRLRAVLNAGYRHGGAAWVVEGEGGNRTPTEYPVFCPKLLAGVGSLPDMLADRSIPIRLQRKLSSERVDRLRIRRVRPEAGALRARVAGWAKTALPRLDGADPKLPDELSDRAQDGWEALLAIADLAAGDWPERARAAAVELHTTGPSDESIGVLLLGHIRDAFDDAGVDKLATAALLRALVEREDGPWGDWWGNDVEASRTKGPASRLAKLLKNHGAKPKKLRFDQDTDRGYERAMFVEAWAHYLPPYPAAGPGAAFETEQSEHPRSEAISETEHEGVLFHGDSRPDQQGSVVPFPRTEPGRDTRARCPRCELVAFFDSATDYGRRRLAEGHLECGGSWDLEQ